jgi:hypothetical protein
MPRLRPAGSASSPSVPTPTRSMTGGAARAAAMTQTSPTVMSCGEGSLPDVRPPSASLHEPVQSPVCLEALGLGTAATADSHSPQRADPISPHSREHCMLVSSSTHHPGQRPAPGETCGHRYASHPSRISCQRPPGHDLEYGHRDSAGPDVQRVWQDDGRSSTRAAPRCQCGQFSEQDDSDQIGLSSPDHGAPRRQRGPSVAVRGKPTVRTDRPNSAYRPS